MRAGDLLPLVWGGLRVHRLRTRMTYLAIAIGVGSVLVLTGLGEGARAWVMNQFASLGSNVLIAMPGRTETRGGIPLLPATTRDLTLEDFRTVGQRLPGFQRAVPVTVGEAAVDHEGRSRSATIVGSTREYLRLRDIRVGRGQDLPEMDVERDLRVCVLGHTLAGELFAEANPVGGKVRIGGYSFRVVGVLAKEGTSMMVDLDEVALVPVASAMRMFNQSGLFRLLVQVSAAADLELAKSRLEAILRERHDGEEDFTVITPGAMAASLGVIIRILTGALAGIAAISLAVAGIGVMNVMVVTVVERAPEIGLMKAVGAGRGQILALFLAEAAALSLIGGFIGVAGGYGITRLAVALWPDIPFRVPGWSLALSLSVAMGVGLTFGLLPAARAARLDPLEALRKRR